jgi:hypothetical protein
MPNQGREREAAAKPRSILSVFCFASTNRTASTPRAVCAGSHASLRRRPRKLTSECGSAGTLLFCADRAGRSGRRACALRNVRGLCRSADGGCRGGAAVAARRRWSGRRRDWACSRGRRPNWACVRMARPRFHVGLRAAMSQDGVCHARQGERDRPPLYVCALLYGDSLY